MTATSKDTSHTLFELACTGGFQNIADTACTLLGNPIAIYDLSLRNIACSRNEHPKLGIFLKYTKDMELSEKRTMHFLEVNYIEQLRKTGAPILIENAATRRIIMAPIYVNGVFSGYINVVEAYSEFKDGDLELAGDICRVISVEMQKSEPLTNSPAVIRERFLAELIETPSHSREYVAARLSALKINANGNFFIAAAERKDRFSHISGNDPLTDGIRSFKKVIMSAVHHDRLVMLLDSESGIPDALSEHLASCSLLTGISNSFSDICRASAGYRQALIALDTAVKLEAPGHIFDFRSFSAYSLISGIDPELTVLDYVHPAVLQLIEHDHTFGTEFADTLLRYLQNMKSLLKTSRELSIHRNTLVYRLARIEELANIDLNDSETFFGLLFSFKALKYCAH